MLKGLEKGSSKLAQNKLFLPGFPENSLPFLFFFSPPGPPNATTESPLHPPTDPHTRTALTHLSPPLDFLLPLSNPPQGTTPLSCKAKPGQPPSFPLILLQQSQRNTVPSPSHQHNPSNASRGLLSSDSLHRSKPPPSSFFTGQQQSSFLQRRPAATGVAATSSVTPTAPAESFPSPLQDSAPLSSSRDQCTPAKKPPLPRQVNFSSPSFHFRLLRFLLHAEPSVCMQEDGGKIIPPRWFLVLGQTCSGPVSFVAGPG